MRGHTILGCFLHTATGSQRLKDKATDQQQFTHSEQPPATKTGRLTKPHTKRSSDIATNPELTPGRPAGSVLLLFIKWPATLWNHSVIVLRRVLYQVVTKWGFILHSHCQLLICVVLGAYISGGMKRAIGWDSQCWRIELGRDTQRWDENYNKGKRCTTVGWNV